MSMRDRMAEDVYSKEYPKRHGDPSHIFDWKFLLGLAAVLVLILGLPVYVAWTYLF